MAPARQTSSVKKRSQTYTFNTERTLVEPVHHTRRDSPQLRGDCVPVALARSRIGSQWCQSTSVGRARVRKRTVTHTSSIVELVAIDGTTLQARGLDCLDGAPLIDERGAADE